MQNEKFYENLLIKNDKFTEDIQIALGLVKKYVVNNKLILVGGMAIDLSLKLKGTQLYDDDVLPDYDFYSPNHHIDAYKIAELLHKVGMKNITVINANHVSTMRVRVNYTVVADVTYIPLSIYKNLPTLYYKELNIIHPHFQMIDQHRALSLPYENSPWEVITHRWEKDATRHDLLYKYYPIKKPKELLDAPISDKFKLTEEIKISSILFKNQCVGGFVGLLYWEQFAKKYGFKSNIQNLLGFLQLESSGLIVQIPIDSHGVSIYSNTIIKLHHEIKHKQTIKKERLYNRFLDKLPFKIIIDDKWELFDVNGYMLSAHKLDMGIYITNLQVIMLYMLTNYILLTKIKNIKRGYSFYIGYLKARELVEWASVMYAKNFKNQKDGGNKKLTAAYKLLLPTAEVYGNQEISDSYINSKRLFLEHIKAQKKQRLQPKIIFPETFVDGYIPKKYYKFVANNSFLFQFSGNEVNEYINRIYI
jgi:hypothetical protein